MSRQLTLPRAILVVWLLTTVGCGRSSNPGQEGTAPTPADDLVEVAGLLKDHSGETGKGPARLEDMAGNQPLYPRGYEAIKSGQVVVVWGVAVGEGGGNGIVAYEKQAESEGGSVLLANGEIKSMSADEFRTAPKAR